MTDIGNPLVVQKFHTYPDEIKPKMLFLRQLILETAEMEKIDHVEETLKWGEPSYLYKSGSTIRIDWKESAPNQYAMYFNCRTILVETFKEIYSDQFTFEGKRAIVFGVDEKIPVENLKHCISLALNYHQIKHLPLVPRPLRLLCYRPRWDLIFTSITNFAGGVGAAAL